MKKAYTYLSIICMVLTILLMTFPHAYGMRWSTGTEYVYSYYSYFSSIPFGNANFFPLITGVLAIISTILLILIVLSNKLQKVTFVIALINLCFSLIIIIRSILMNTIAIESISITLLIAATFVFQLLYKHAK